MSQSVLNIFPPQYEDKLVHLPQLKNYFPKDGLYGVSIAVPLQLKNYFPKEGS